MNPPTLDSYDYILVNTSGGKDSQTLLRYVVRAARCRDVLNRVVAVHAILAREEWPGTESLARQQAGMYGVPFYTVQRSQGLIEHILERGKWPSPACRYCTSDHKRDQVAKLVTELVTKHDHAGEKKQLRVLNCMGMRAEESPARAKLMPFQRDGRLSNGKRIVDRWLPIHEWSVKDVWKDIRISGVPHHPAYDLGMPRLSCVFCIFAPRDALMLAGKHNMELLREYVAMEEKMGHTFKKDLALKDVLAALEAGEEPKKATDWKM